MEEAAAGESGGAAAPRGGRGPSASSDVMVAREGGAAQARRVSPTSHVGCAPSSCHSSPPNRTRRTSDAGTSEEASAARARSSTSAGRSVDPGGVHAEHRALRVVAHDVRSRVERAVRTDVHTP